MTNPLTIALVTDIHYGADYGTIAGSSADDLLRGVLEQIADHEPDLLVDLGDRLNDESPEQDTKRLEQLAEIFGTLDAPRAHLAGNHDLVHVDRGRAESILGSPLQKYSVDMLGWHLVFWNAVCDFPDLHLPQEDLDWLEADLSSTELPAIVFAHVPVGGASTLGNYHFEELPEGRATYQNAGAAREILCASDTCKLVFGGHRHWNSLHTVDGVHFVTLPAVSETFTTHPRPAEGWALVELGEEARVRVFGRDAREYVLPFRARGEHWLARS